MSHLARMGWYIDSVEQTRRSLTLIMFFGAALTANRASFTGGDMTRAEELINKRDEQTRMAIECFQRGDNSGAAMHRNMAEGFSIKLDRLTAEECRENV